MKKENVTGIIVYVIILVLAVVFGITVLREYFEFAGNKAMESWQFVLFIVGAVLSGAVGNAILFELAHVIGAKAGGYKILSVSVFGLTLVKVEEKWKLKFSNYDGLTGETKILPKDGRKKEPNPTLYLLLGTLFFAIEIIAAVFVFAYMSSNEDKSDLHWAYFILTAAVVGAMILIYNIIPLHLDSMTDGYRLRQVAGAKNRKAFNDLLRMEAGVAVAEGADQGEAATSFSADIKLNTLYEYLNKRDYANALTVIKEDILTNPKISKSVYLRAKAQEIYVNIMMKSLPEALEYYDAEVPLDVRRHISNDVSMDCIRAYVLMSGLLDKSRSECNLALKNLLRAYRDVPKNRKDLERQLFNDGLQKVIEAHPTWELEKFLMKDPEEK
mgnify:CR=1 FL=1